jgi:hypothetical protein
MELNGRAKVSSITELHLTPSNRRLYPVAFGMVKGYNLFPCVVFWLEAGPSDAIMKPSFSSDVPRSFRLQILPSKSVLVQTPNVVYLLLHSLFTLFHDSTLFLFDLSARTNFGHIPCFVFLGPTMAVLLLALGIRIDRSD